MFYQMFNHRLAEKARDRIADLLLNRPPAPMELVSDRESLDRRCLWDPEPAIIPVERPYPWPGLGCDRDRRKIRM